MTQDERNFPIVDSDLSKTIIKSSSDAQIHCPICGCINMHIKTSGQKDGWAKRVTHFVHFICESGEHEFQLVFSDHKGTVFVELLRKQMTQEEWDTVANGWEPEVNQ